VAGAKMPRVVAKEFRETLLPLPPLAEQERIASELDAVAATLKKRQTQLAELDALVEARFVELFGEQLANSRDWKIKKLDELYEIIDGDRGKNYPKQEEFLTEGHCLFLNAKNVTKNGFCFAERLFITREKDEILRTGKLKKNDIVLTTRGTIGNVAYYDSSVSFEHIRINSGMVLLRNCSSLISTPYFIEFFRRFKPFQRLITGTAQPQLPISLLRQIEVPAPPLELQERFAAEVERVEALKATVRDGIAETQTLFDALTARYFG
jgi:type I restriction enzyme S subunit